MLKTTNHPNRLLIFSRPCRLTSISLEDEFQENICFIDYAKAFDCVNHNKLQKILRDGNTRSPYLSPEKPV